jgi:hypothetical protein
MGICINIVQICLLCVCGRATVQIDDILHPFLLLVNNGAISM